MLKRFITIYRPLNVLFLGLSQFWLVAGNSIQLSHELLTWILGTMCIAAGGYAKNYYDDIQPVSNLKHITHILFALGNICLAFLSYKTGFWLFVASGVFASVMLAYYSTFLKSKGVIGNISIALLTAWVFIGLALVLLITNAFDYASLMLLAWFAFLSTLIREWVKDIEDLEQDLLLKRRTLPVVFGVRITALLQLVFTCILLFKLVSVIETQSSIFIKTTLHLTSFIYLLYSFLTVFKEKYSTPLKHIIKGFQSIIIAFWPFLIH